MQIPSRVNGSLGIVLSDSSGNIVPTAVWKALRTGRYDILIDVNSNGKYDSGIDALDNNDIWVTGGLLVVPELWLGALLGLVACLASFGIFYVTKRNYK